MIFFSFHKIAIKNFGFFFHIRLFAKILYKSWVGGRVWTNGQTKVKAHVTHNIFAHNIVIKRHFEKKKFLQNIVVTFQNIFKLVYNKQNCPKINIVNLPRKKIGWKMSFYLFIGISFYINTYCVQKNIVRALGLYKLWDKQKAFYKIWYLTSNFKMT